MKNFRWGKGSLSRMIGVHDVLIEFADRILAKTKLDVTIPYMGGCRTSEEQYELYKRKASKCDGIMKRSRHQTGYAIDIVASGKTIDSMYDHDKLDYINSVAKTVWAEMICEGVNGGYRMVFGCDWKNFQDKPHYELRE